MARNVLPNQIPEDGVRYNLTLMRMGKGKGTINCVFVIDSGDKRGHRISGILSHELHDMIVEHLDKCGVSEREAGYYDTDDAAYYGAVNRNARTFRCSAVVTVTYMAVVDEEWIHVQPDYQESNVRVTYELNDYQEPIEESEIADKL